MSRRNAVLLIILIVFFAVSVWISDPFSKNRLKASEIPLFDADMVADADSIRIESEKEGIIEIIKKENAWLIPEEDNYPADPVSIKRILDNLSDIKAGRQAVKNLDNLDKYGLNPENEVKVSLFQNNEPFLEISIGKNGPDLLSSFLKSADEDFIRLVPGNLRYYYQRPLSDFKDKTVLDLSGYDIMEVEIIGEEYSAIIVKDEEQGYILKESADEKELNQETAGRIISSLKPLRADAFLEDEDSPDQHDLNRDTPIYVLNVTTSNEEKFRLLVLGMNSQRSRFFVTNQDMLYTKAIFSAKIESLFPPAEKLFNTLDEIQE